MVIGVIGGSGLYQWNPNTSESIPVSTPYGAPSGEYYQEKLGEHTILFLARHGQGHRLLPSEVNYRANIYGFKKLGAQRLISVSAVGSLKKEIAPGDFVLPDQYLDFTKGLRSSTFFGDGIVAHVPFADPSCQTLRTHLFSLARELGIKTHLGGTYVCMEGPQFSTRAESHLYRSWDLGGAKVAVIGMTALPEAKLAREAGLCYQTIAMATDYDCWNEEHRDVSVEAILKLLRENAEASKELIATLTKQPVPACRFHCADLTRQSLVTPREIWPSSKQEEMAIILG